MICQSTKTRILCVEDHPATRLTLKLVFDQAGYHTASYATLFESLRLAAGQSLDLYLFDIDLPDESGIDLARRIHAFDSHTPLTFLSANVFSKNVDAGMTIGAQVYITRPMSMDYLLETVSSLFQKGDVAMAGSELRATQFAQ